MIKLSDNIPVISDGKYKGVKVTSIIKAIKSREIKRHLSLKQKNIIDEIDNLYRTNGFIIREDFLITWKLYVNYVQFDYRRILINTHLKSLK